MRKASEKHADSKKLKRAKHKNLSKPPKQKKIKPTFLKGRDIHYAFKKAKDQTQFSVRPTEKTFQVFFLFQLAADLLFSPKATE
jgi:hypothetical protein